MPENGQISRHKSSKTQNVIIGAGLALLLLICFWFASLTASGNLGGAVAFIIALFISAIVVIVSIVLSFYGRGRQRIFAFAFAAIFPVASFLTITLAGRFSPEHLTKEYGVVIAQQLDQYRADHGNYPETLEQLIPTYLTDLREPKTVWGWLYVGTSNTFSLGYVSYVDRMGYSVAIYTSESRNWDSLMYSDGPFDLPPTPSSF